MGLRNRLRNINVNFYSNQFKGKLSIMSQFFAAIKRHAFRLLISLTILLFFVLHAFKIAEWHFINALEYKIYDARLKLSMPKTMDNNIVIVNIDEKSLSEIGRWPWNRSVMAGLIDQLFDTYQIDVFGIDIVFPEPDESSGLIKLQKLAQGALKDAPAFLEELKNLEKTLDYDALFAQSLKNRRVVLSYAFTDEQEESNESGQLPPPVFTEKEGPLNHLKAATGFAAN